jgi:hypothetical protein
VVFAGLARLGESSRQFAGGALRDEVSLEIDGHGMGASLELALGGLPALAFGGEVGFVPEGDGVWVEDLGLEGLGRAPLRFMTDVEEGGETLWVWGGQLVEMVVVEGLSGVEGEPRRWHHEGATGADTLAQVGLYRGWALSAEGLVAEVRAGGGRAPRYALVVEGPEELLATMGHVEWAGERLELVGLPRVGGDGDGDGNGDGDGDGLKEGLRLAAAAGTGLPCAVMFLPTAAEVDAEGERERVGSMPDQEGMYAELLDWWEGQAALWDEEEGDGEGEGGGEGEGDELLDPELAALYAEWVTAIGAEEAEIGGRGEVPGAGRLEARADELVDMGLGVPGLVLVGIGDGFVGNVVETVEGVVTLAGLAPQVVKLVLVDAHPGVMLARWNGKVIHEFTHGDRFAGELAVARRLAGEAWEGGKRIMGAGRVVYDALRSVEGLGEVLALALLEGVIQGTDAGLEVLWALAYGWHEVYAELPEEVGEVIEALAYVLLVGAEEVRAWVAAQLDGIEKAAYTVAYLVGYVSFEVILDVVGAAASVLTGGALAGVMVGWKGARVALKVERLLDRLGQAGAKIGKGLEELIDAVLKQVRGKAARMPAGAGFQYDGVAGQMIAQPTANTCGPACGYQLLKEIDGTSVHLSNLTRNWYKGLEPADLAMNMNRFGSGWTGGFLEGTARELSALSANGSFVARIGGWASAQGRHLPGHFVIVDKVEGGKVFLRDPAGGVGRTLNEKDFLEIFNGAVWKQ